MAADPRRSAVQGVGHLLAGIAAFVMVQGPYRERVCQCACVCLCDLEGVERENKITNSQLSERRTTAVLVCTEVVSQQLRNPMQIGDVTVDVQSYTLTRQFGNTEY